MKREKKKKEEGEKKKRKLAESVRYTHAPPPMTTPSFVLFFFLLLFCSLRQISTNSGLREKPSPKRLGKNRHVKGKEIYNITGTWTYFERAKRGKREGEKNRKVMRRRYIRKLEY